MYIYILGSRPSPSKSPSQVCPPLMSPDPVSNVVRSRLTCRFCLKCRILLELSLCPASSVV